jgi:hypothetical protein
MSRSLRYKYRKEPFYDAAPSAILINRKTRVPWDSLHKILRTDTFLTEHGVTLTGDETVYRKGASQRAIEQDQFRLEDHSGNAAHVGNSF